MSEVPRLAKELSALVEQKATLLEACAKMKKANTSLTIQLYEANARVTRLQNEDRELEELMARLEHENRVLLRTFETANTQNKQVSTHFHFTSDLCVTMALAAGG